MPLTLDRKRHSRVRFWLIAAFLLALAVVAFAVIRSAQRKDLNQFVAIAEHGAGELIQVRFRQSILALTRMASRIEQAQGDAARAMWRLDAQNYIKHNQGYIAVWFLDEKFAARDVVWAPGSTVAHATDGIERLRAHFEGLGAFPDSPTLTSPDKWKGPAGQYFLTFPVGGESPRFLTILIALEEFLAGVLQEKFIVPGFAIEILSEGAPVFRRDTEHSATEIGRSSAPLDLYGSRFEVKASPSVATSSRHRSYFPHVALVAALAVGVLFWWALFLAREARAAAKVARFATEAKSQFLANMSHEIRSPLTSMLGYIESLQIDRLSHEDASKLLRVVQENGQHLLELINDILDLSKIEAGQLPVEKLDFPLLPLLRQVQEVMRQRASAKGLILSVEYHYPLPDVIRSDPTRLRQILVNVIGNAIKFTEAGSVTVVFSCNGFTESFECEVTDSGIGISEAQMSQLFTPFSQGDTSMSRRFGGTGLGLAISRDLARKLGGDISVKSEVGKGSQFTVTVGTGSLQKVRWQRVAAVAQQSEEKAASPSTPALSGSVLVADDGKHNREFLSFLLRKTGVSFDVVGDGEQALKAVSQKTYDLILMDMQMPIVDGFTATKRLREEGFNKPIVALTANAMQEDRERCLACGCTEYLSKPFSRAGFFRMLSSFLPIRKESGASGEVEGSQMDEVRRKFLLALDERVSELQRLLTMRGFEEMRTLSHKLASAGLFGLAEVGEVAGRIELMIGSSSVDHLSEAIKELQRAADSAKEQELLQ